jgi:hypothetical protein
MWRILVYGFKKHPVQRLLIESVKGSAQSQTTQQCLGAFLAFVAFIATAAVKSLFKCIDGEQSKGDGFVVIER